MLNDFVNTLTKRFPLSITDRVNALHWIEAMSESGMNATEIRHVVETWAINKVVNGW